MPDPVTTDEQINAARALQGQMGRVPDRILIDKTYGILRLDFCADGKHFFVDRDGKRIFWQEP